MSGYGLPYQGSKNSIAEWVLDHLPAADTLVDLMAGCCAVSHAALMSGKYKHVIANDITDTALIFDAAMRGEMDGYATVLTRDEFNQVKDTDTLAAMIYSFGNNRTDYLYGRDIEPVETAASRMILAPSVYERRMAYRTFISELEQYMSSHGTQLDRISKLPAIERVQRIQKLNNIRVPAGTTFTPLQGDYRTVDMPADAIIYIDPPYRGTDCKAYNGFDVDSFDTWLQTVPNLTIVSEYTPPPECVEIASIEKPSRMPASDNTKKAIEKLFIPARQLDRYKQAMGLLF